MSIYSYFVLFVMLVIGFYLGRERRKKKKGEAKP